MTPRRALPGALVALLLAAPLAGCKPPPEPEPEPTGDPRGKSVEGDEAATPAEPSAEKQELGRFVEIQKEKGEAKGRWRGYRTHVADEDLTDEQRAMVERLEAIGYATGSAPPPDRSGVTVYDREKAHAGLNLFTSGHGQVAQLMDMDGRVLHEWSADFWEIWPDYPVGRQRTGTQYWRRVQLLDDGAVLVIYEGMGIVKLDKDSNVVWANPNRAHHDLQVQADGSIVVLTREAHVLPRINAERPVLEDFVTILEPDGSERSRLSLLECFENSEKHARIIAGLGDEKDLDLFHTNAVRVLDGSQAGANAAFAADHYLISSYKLDRLAVVDPVAREVTWALRKDFHRQHDPTLLDENRLLLFDNRGKRGRSRVLEYDLRSLVEPVWVYEGSVEQPFYTHTCGVAQRLPGGTTLITESDNGRAFEVTSDGTVVWEYINPHRAGENDEFIASLVELQRLPADAPLEWLDGGGR